MWNAYVARTAPLHAAALAATLALPFAAAAGEPPGLDGAPASELRLGPVDGLTMAWHPAPKRTSIPAGRIVVLETTAPPEAAVQWAGAVEIARDERASTAICVMADAATYRVGAEVILRDGTRVEHSSVFDAVWIDPGAITTTPITVRVAPFELDESATNDETVAAWFGESIAPLERIGDGRFRTSTDRVVRFEVGVDPPGFGPLVEWWIDGAYARIGDEISLWTSRTGTFAIELSAGSATKGVELDIYEVRITSHAEGDAIPEDEPVTFTAVTDPPGLEGKIHWLSSTKFGSAAPVVGTGPSFTVTFEDTFGPGGRQWLGVRAANAAFGQDAKPCVDDPDFISRAEAMQAVIDQVITGHPDEAEIVAFSHPDPLGPGSFVEPWFVETGPPMFATECSWFFFLEIAREAMCQRDSLYCLVSGSPGRPIVEVTNQAWPAVLDGVETLYDVPEEYEQSPDIFFGEFPTDDVNCADKGGPPPPLLPPAPNVWGLAFTGPGMWIKNRTKFRDDILVGALGIPVENTRSAGFGKEELDDAIQDANDDDASCVYVYIGAHMLVPDKNLQSIRRSEPVSPTQLATALATLEACSVHVVIDACYVGENFIQPIIDALAKRDPATLNAHDPPTIGVFTSSSRDNAANNVRSGGTCKMAYWSRDFIKCWTDAEADGDDEGRDVNIFEAFDWVLENGCATALRGDPQAGGLSFADCGGFVVARYDGRTGWTVVDRDDPRPRPARR